MSKVLLEKISFSEQDTIEFVNECFDYIVENKLVVLTGNLGSGKTFFVKEFCKLVGINSVTSPTFALINEYNGSIKIYHFDFYRINSVNEIINIGFYDYLNDSDAIIFIEWGELFKEIIPSNHIEIIFKIENEEKRDIKLISRN